MATSPRRGSVSGPTVAQRKSYGRRGLPMSQVAPSNRQRRAGPGSRVKPTFTPAIKRK